MISNYIKIPKLLSECRLLVELDSHDYIADYGGISINLDTGLIAN